MCAFRKGIEFIMITKELSEAAVEINSIFDNMTTETLKKVPNNFRDFLKKISSKTYSFQYDKIFLII